MIVPVPEPSLIVSGGARISTFESPGVVFVVRPMITPCSAQRATTAAERDAYVATGEPLDKAGAYAIQGIAAVFVQHLQGSYSGVMGLPLFETASLLAGAGIRIP